MLLAEGASCGVPEAEIVTIEREDLLSPATTGLTIAEGKTILENLQKRIVVAQVEHHGASMKTCCSAGHRCALKDTIARCSGRYTATCPCAFGGSEGAPAL